MVLDYGSFQKSHLYSMKSYLLFALFYFTNFTAFSQDALPDVPTHYIRTPIYHSHTVGFPAYIDSTLFARYLDWQLQKDSLPQQYRNGKPFSITVYYIVSKEGKISDVKLFQNKGEQEDIFELIRTKLLACPYQWSPAYQNGRPVNAYFRLRIIRNQ